jgi:hypothetical protein
MAKDFVENLNFYLNSISKIAWSGSEPNALTSFQRELHLPQAKQIAFGDKE